MASLILPDRVSGVDTTPARKHVGQAYIFINVKGGNCYTFSAYGLRFDQMVYIYGSGCSYLPSSSVELVIPLPANRIGCSMLRVIDDNQIERCVVWHVISQKQSQNK